MSEKESKESQYIVLHPGLVLDPPFGSDRDPSVTYSILAKTTPSLCDQYLDKLVHYITYATLALVENR